MSDLDERRVDLLRDGYTVCREVVGACCRDAALHTINAAVGRGIAREEAEQHKNGLQWPHLMGNSTIIALFRDSGAAEVVARLIGGAGVHPVHGGQIALRFPGGMCADEAGLVAMPGWDTAWHIDGLPGALPHMAPGRLDTFTALVGVCLQDVTRELQGNFVAYPGSHWILQEHFRRHGTAAVEMHGEEGLPRDMPFAEARQVCLRAGDITVAHYALAHSIAPNTSPHIRYMVYFRVHSRLRTPDEYSSAHLTDIWAHWPGMAAFVDGFVPQPGCGLPTSADEEAASLAAVGQPLITAQDWTAAAPLFHRLSQLRPRCYLYRLQAGLAAAFVPRPAAAGMRAQAEEHLRAAADLAPADAAAPCALAIVLVERGDVATAASLIDANLLAPMAPFVSESSRPLVTAAVVATQAALRGVGREAEAEVQRARLEARFDFLADAAAASAGAGGDTAGIQELWANLMACLAREPKTAEVWAEGRRLGGRLAELQPGEFWPQMVLAICFTYDMALRSEQAAAGAEFARRAAAIDSASPLPSALLCRSVQRQGTAAAVSATVLAHFARVLETGERAPGLDVGEHAWLLMDALRCARAAEMAQGAVGGRARFAVLLAAFKAAFPSLATQADSVSGERASCCLM